MNGLHDKVAEYLAVRRAMGYKLERAARLLPQFVDHLDGVGACSITVEYAVAWATLPQGPRREAWWAERLSIVRRFATWLAAFDSSAEVPPAGLLPCRPRRGGPGLFSPGGAGRPQRGACGPPSPLRPAALRPP